MEPEPPIRSALIDACRSLIRNFNDFWVFGSVTDYSFEEGDRSAHFKKVIRSYEAVGAPAPLLLQMRKGINGNLAELLARCGAVRNKWKGQDLLLSDGNGNNARVEIKQVFDCTHLKYYRSVAADLRKLKAVSEQGFAGGLFLVVFFVQMPNLRYAKRWGARRVVCVGIREQYRKVCEAIGAKALWPAEEPEMAALHLPADEHTRTSFEARFESMHGPNSGLAVDGVVKDAAVGVAVWQFVPVIGPRERADEREGFSLN